MNFNITGSKTDKSGHLCKRCQHSISTTFQDNTVVWRCAMFQTVVRKPVADCQRFYPIGVATTFELEQQAYMIDKDIDGEVTIHKKGLRYKTRIRRRVSRRNPVPAIQEVIN